MLNKLFKRKIPLDNAQEVTELQSYSVTWWVKTGWSDDSKRQAKVFISIDDAKEYEKQLKESAKFLGCWVSIELSEN